MVDIENVKILVDMYKKDKISDYVLGRELSEFFGDLVSVEIEKENISGAKSYCVFAIPERKKEGFKLTFIIDAKAIKNIYQDDDFAIVCERLKKQIHNILRKYNKFYLETSLNDTSLFASIGFLLELYSFYRSDLLIGDGEYLPDENELLKYKDKFVIEEANSEDLESIKIKGFISNKIIDAAKKYIKSAIIINTKIGDFGEPEKPVFCMGQQEMIKHVSSTFGVRDHKEIPYDYLPKTNQ